MSEWCFLGPHRDHAGGHGFCPMSMNVGNLTVRSEPLNWFRASLLICIPVFRLRRHLLPGRVWLWPRYCFTKRYGSCLMFASESAVKVWSHPGTGWKWPSMIIQQDAFRDAKLYDIGRDQWNPTDADQSWTIWGSTIPEWCFRTQSNAFLNWL